MKLQSNQTINLLKELSKEEMKFLTNGVKEILSADFKKEEKKVFSAAQLWNIQRRRKNLFIQRSYL
jgi:hypothetical protein